MAWSLILAVERRYQQPGAVPHLQHLDFVTAFSLFTVSDNRILFKVRNSVLTSIFILNMLEYQR